MANRLQKILWSVLCGTALGLGPAGCYDSDDQTAYGPPPDSEADSGPSDVTDADDEPEMSPLYGAPEYGPPYP